MKGGLVKAIGPRFRKASRRSIFLVPALLFIIIFIAGPIAQTVVLSFLSGEGEFVGLENYETVITSRDTVNARNLPWPPPLGTLLHNALWIAIHLPISLLAGLWLAVLLRDVRGASVVKSLIFLGMVTPMIVGGVILKFLFSGGVGIIPSLFGLLGDAFRSAGWEAAASFFSNLNVNWMVHRETLLIGLIFGSVWLWTGFSLIVYSAGLTTIPKEFFEAAKIDGASAFRTFFRITFPLLKPMTITVLTMTLLWELKIFDVVFAAAGDTGGVRRAADVMALQMYRLAFVAGSFNLAAVVATILTVMTLLATVGMLRYMVRK